jgi:hypothetical protein
VLRTRAPVVSGIATLLPLDLHVLGLPLALILSQDQTLHCKIILIVSDFVSQIRFLEIWLVASYQYFKELFYFY